MFGCICILGDFTLLSVNPSLEVVVTDMRCSWCGGILIESPDKPELYCLSCKSLYEVWYGGEMHETLQLKS
jgi:hypothetical protein